MPYSGLFLIFGSANLQTEGTRHMSELKKGLYEEVLTEGLQKDLEEHPEFYTEIEKLDEEEASRILAKYTSDRLEKSLRALRDRGKGIQSQISLVNELILHLTKQDDTVSEEERVTEEGSQLLALYDKKDPIIFSLREKKLPRPKTSLAMSSLFTGARHEPQMYKELKQEILSADRIDLLVSFIRWTGLRLLMEELREFTRRGGKIRVITTSYMGATDLKAIRELSLLPNTEIRVSYDTKRTRLHAKTYVFYRNTGYTTAYVGSSNLSEAAMSSGLEWNVKLTRTDLPDTLDKIEATFDSYWNMAEFEPYNADQEGRLRQALNMERGRGEEKEEQVFFDLRPYAFQEEILEELLAERELRGRYKNLVVAATGTGKTVISAFDYRRYRKSHPDLPGRLLFICHREEILRQSLHTFRAVLRDPNFGDLLVGNHIPEQKDYLFLSIQSFRSKDFTSLTERDFYDYIVVDEFHHAAAPSYRELLTYYRPKILLGLTATPERMDGKDILEYFDGRIAAEIRLPEAIDRKLLSPFQYFGVTDSVDLSKMKWTRGGYDTSELSKVYTMDEYAAKHRAELIRSALYRYVTDPERVKGLGFCVSVKHAEFMEKSFQDAGIPSIHLSGKSTEEERRSAKRKLVSGDIRFIFVVDLYNEGIDIPEVNTILFLRPTESLTVFLQQLGRGLRLAEGKECLTVLDFIGQAHKRYRFEEKFESLLAITGRSMIREIKEGFPSAPRGCFIQLEKVASQHVLRSIRDSLRTQSDLVMRIREFEEDTGKKPTLTNFLRHYHMEPKEFYRRGESFGSLAVRAGVREEFSEELQALMEKAFLRFSSIDSRRWILFLLRVLDEDASEFSEEEEAMLQMLQFTIWQKNLREAGFSDFRAMLQAIRQSPVMKDELTELLRYRYESIDFVDIEASLPYVCPLDVHCTYTRDQILTGLGFLKPDSVREGVKYLSDKKTDLFFITLNKSDKDYSPTTMYKDYSVNESLFHWQSQSTTSEQSDTGQRYIRHRVLRSNVLLFVREYKKDPKTGAAMPYTFLGSADYVSHEGSRPMNILWRLENPIPARFLKKTSQMIAI